MSMINNYKKITFPAVMTIKLGDKEKNLIFLFQSFHFH